MGLYGRRCTSARDNAARPIGRSGKVCSVVKRERFCDDHHSASAAAKIGFKASPEGGNRERELISGLRQRLVEPHPPGSLRAAEAASFSGSVLDRNLVGGKYDSPCCRNCSCRRAERAIGGNVLQWSDSSGAGNLLASKVTVRHTACLPKAVRCVHRNWLLECGASEEMRIREAIGRRMIRPTHHSRVVSFF